MSNENSIKGKEIAATISEQQKKELLKTLNEFFELVQPSNLLEAQSEMMSAFLEQQGLVLENIDNSNRIFRINQQSRFVIKLYEIYKDVQAQA